MRTEQPERVASAVIATSFTISALASIGLAIVYALGGHVQAEGALLFLALGGLAVGLVMWSKHLMPGGEFVEEREPHPSRPQDRGGAIDQFKTGEREVGRRTFLGKMLGAAVGLLGLVALFPIRSLGQRPGGELFGTQWESGLRLVTPDNIPVNVSDLEFGSFLTVFPEGRTNADDSPVVVMRVDPEAFEEPPGREGWSPQGLVAYSKLCTHAGCAVGLYQPASQELFCPCHQSVFDVMDGAKPLGGPATRPLPQLPLGIDDQGFIFALSDFHEPVGPGFWRRGS